MKKYLLIIILFANQNSFAQSKDFPDLYSSHKYGVPDNNPKAYLMMTYLDYVSRKEREKERLNKIAENEALYASLAKEVDVILSNRGEPANIDEIRVVLRKIYHDKGNVTELLQSKIRLTFHQLNTAFPPATAESAPTLGGQQ